MRTFNKQAASLKKNLKQNNLMPLFVVFSVIVMLSLTYKSVSKVNGVGNTMFKEGNRNRRRRVRQGFREGTETTGEVETTSEVELMVNENDDDDDGFRNRRRRVRQGFREGATEKKDPLGAANENFKAAPEGFLSGAKYQGFTSSRGRVRRARGRK